MNDLGAVFLASTGANEWRGNPGVVQDAGSFDVGPGRPGSAWCLQRGGRVVTALLRACRARSPGSAIGTPTRSRHVSP